MKCSPQRNCNICTSHNAEYLVPASMKCSPQRILLPLGRTTKVSTWAHFNEVQFPKELQPVRQREAVQHVQASMKCSSRRNCNSDWPSERFFLPVPQ